MYTRDSQAPCCADLADIVQAKRSLRGVCICEVRKVIGCHDRRETRATGRPAYDVKHLRRILGQADSPRHHKPRPSHHHTSILTSCLVDHDAEIDTS